jgi:2-oxoglutarate dehydrogenase E1 component
LQTSGRGKVSFTHLIAWAIVRALKDYPQLNNGYGFVNNAPSRLENASVNLGIAIDIEKKDGSRNLLVPNVKNSTRRISPNFSLLTTKRLKKRVTGNDD